MTADFVAGLRLDGQLAIRAMLHAKASVEEAQKVVYLCDGSDGAFAAAAAGTLFDADGGGQAGDEIDIGAGHLLDELAGVGVHGVEKAALTLGEEEVESEGAFARAADARDDNEFVARDGNGEIFEVVFARPDDADGIIGGRAMVSAIAHL